jgi:hypothetical protein
MECCQKLRSTILDMFIVQREKKQRGVIFNKEGSLGIWGDGQDLHLTTKSTRSLVPNRHQDGGPRWIIEHDKIKFLTGYEETNIYKGRRRQGSLPSGIIYTL